MQLREYQAEDVARLVPLSGAGIFNEQRTGKTPTAIMTMESKKVSRLLIVCPASLIFKWAEEYTQWTGKDTYVITSATTFNNNIHNLKGIPCIIISYDNLRTTKANEGAVQNLLHKYKPEGIIVDEAHRIKGRTNATAKAIYRFNNVPHKLALTGTPAPNTQDEVWSILHFLDHRKFSSYWKFIEEYFLQDPILTSAGVKYKPSIISPYKEKEFQEVLDSMTVMRKRKDVMPWLPKYPDPTIIKLPCTTQQIKYINELTEYFVTEHIDVPSVLTQLIRIRQICGAPEILNLKGGSPKIAWLKQYVKDYPDKSILVFSNSKKLLDLLFVELEESMIITGSVDAEDRQDAINKFQKKLCNILLLQTQACKEGLTLDQADVTIFLDTYPPASDYLQAKDRMVAVSPERVKPQELIHVMMKNTYDEELYKLVNKNISETEVINDFINYLRRT